ncbi:nuclear transport factor 2 family protein [Dietzia sp. ANT_WB102]|uniref:nuclear transport factor 2 family protein n=1 Tax=Dietzia sp. ANT_WB102 TaxID=2597345 RepID=UPI0011F0039D|nr:nuclear transport factor 2 family protein [Dietzia sp. ANT_WB102]KAA0918318.1 nuclear transport factor 2 family protein [Dietzia sp. ANT_WB102]
MQHEEIVRAREAIEQLKYRYWRACDAKDPEGFRSCFVATGGVLDFGPLGRTDPDTMVGIFRQIALATAEDGGPRILDMHHGFMPSITVEDGGPSSPPRRATGTWTLHFRQVDRDKGTETLSTGEYSDVYVLEGGRWVMAECLFTPGWSITRSLDDATVTFPDVTVEPVAATAGADS